MPGPQTRSTEKKRTQIHLKITQKGNHTSFIPIPNWLEVFEKYKVSKGIEVVFKPGNKHNKGCVTLWQWSTTAEASEIYKIQTQQTNLKDEKCTFKDYNENILEKK